MGGLDPPIQSHKRLRSLPWMAGSEAGHGELESELEGDLEKPYPILALPLRWTTGFGTCARAVSNLRASRSMFST